MATAVLGSEGIQDINPLISSDPARLKPILRSSIGLSSSIRYDRAGTAIQDKKHKITFVDRVLKNVPIHTVFEVEAIEYSEPSPRQKGCTCSLL